MKGTAPQGKNVLGLWKDKLLDQPHRHPSHLMAIYPAMDITIDGPDTEQKIIAASVFQYLSLGQYCWAGHTYVEMASFMAMLGDGRMAYEFLRIFLERWTRPNGLHFNRELGKFGHSNFVLGRYGTIPRELDTHGQFTVNETCASTRAVSDMLLQSWGGKIRLFPAVPGRWSDALFVDLVTEGNFRVSALRRAGKVVWVRICAGVDGECRLVNPFGMEPYALAGISPALAGGLMVFPPEERGIRGAERTRFRGHRPGGAGAGDTPSLSESSRPRRRWLQHGAARDRKSDTHANVEATVLLLHADGRESPGRLDKKHNLQVKVIEK